MEQHQFVQTKGDILKRIVFAIICMLFDNFVKKCLVVVVDLVRDSEQS